MPSDGRPGRVGALLLALLLLAAGPSGRAAAEDQPAEKAQGRPIEAALRGVEAGNLRDLLTRSAELLGDGRRHADSRATLQRWIDGDEERLARVLRAEGYYDHSVAGEIVEATDAFVVVFEVESGPQYLLEEFAIDYDRPPDPAVSVPREMEDLELFAGMPARGATIVDAEGRLRRRLAERGYPNAVVGPRRAVVDHDRRIMTVSEPVQLGPFLRFGELRFEGLERVERGYLQRLIDLPAGEVYDVAEVEAAERTLSRTGLFDSVSIAPETPPTVDGPAPLLVSVVEAAPRSIGAGLSYSTSESLGANVFWEHRNLFGRAERLRLSSAVSLLRQEAIAAFRKPNVWRKGQDIVADSSVIREDTEAFDSIDFAQSLAIDRQVGDHWRVSLGGLLEYSILDEGDDEPSKTFFLVGLPASARYENVDDPLDPTRGFRFGLSSTPYSAFIEETIQFLVTEATGSTYYDLTDNGGVVLAGRTRIGSIVGAGRGVIPANKRFYAGGGGSIRGFDFRSAGPLDDSQDPIGGRSVFEVGAEVRFRITEDIGLVPFIEGGTVFESVVPDFSEDILWGAGLGLRYYTAIGPIRLDLATPLNPRDNDDLIQFYVSIGQAF